MRFLRALFAVAALLVSLMLFVCCARESGHDLLAEEELERIREDLAIRTCQTRMDSLCFEIDGLIYEAGLEEYTGDISDIIPEPLPVCPLSGLEYVITETSGEVTVTCPSGHGSQTVVK